MTQEELKAFESWLMQAYQANSTIDFRVLSTAMRIIRAKAR